MNRSDIPNLTFAATSIAGVAVAASNGAFAAMYPLPTGAEATWPRLTVESKGAQYRVKSAAGVFTTIPGRASVLQLRQTKYNGDGSEAGSLRLRLVLTTATDVFTPTEVGEFLTACSAFITDTEGKRMFTLGEACVG